MPTNPVAAALASVTLGPEVVVHNVERRVFETDTTQGTAPAPPVRSFHPKAYTFRRGDTGTAFVGSSNLSASALTTAVEWNYRVVSSADGSGFQETIAAFEELFAQANTRRSRSASVAKVMPGIPPGLAWWGSMPAL